MLHILYGGDKKMIDVTLICHQCLKKENVIRIPKTDIQRTKLFGDPYEGYPKNIYIVKNGKLLYKLDRMNDTYIDINISQVFIKSIPSYIFNLFDTNYMINQHAQFLNESKNFDFYTLFLKWCDPNRRLIVYNGDNSDKDFYNRMTPYCVFTNDKNALKMKTEDAISIVMYSNIDVNVLLMNNIKWIFICTEKNNEINNYLESNKFICIDSLSSNKEVWCNPYSLIKN